MESQEVHQQVKELIGLKANLSLRSGGWVLAYNVGRHNRSKKHDGALRPGKDGDYG